MSSATQPHILVVDDDPAMRKLIGDYLTENSLRVTAAVNGAAMRQALAQHTIDLVVLDLRLAGEDGMQLARDLRTESAVPIIMVTGKQEEADRVMGLELGADDYILKPFSPRELLARIRAVLRRYQTAQALLPARDDSRRAYRFQGWELNMRSRRLMDPDGQRVELTNGEFNLLQAFCTAPFRVLARELTSICRACMAPTGVRPLHRRADPAASAQDQAEPARPQYIETESAGAGYVFSVPWSPVLSRRPPLRACRERALLKRPRFQP
jgi:DNA-binding response OmpR family regulator